MIKTWSLAGLCACLCACVAVPERDASTVVATPPVFQTAAQPQAPLAVCAALSPPGAQAWLQRVATDNLDLRRAAARLRQAEAIAASAASPLLPRLDAQIDATRSDSPFVRPVPAPGTTTSWQGSVAASYELDVWSRLRNEKRAAELDAAATELNLQSLALTLQSQTLDAWYTTIAQRQLTALLDEQMSTSERFLELTRLRFGLGQVPAQDIGRQKQQVLNLRGQQVLASANAELLLSRLEALAGVAPGTYELATGPMPPAPAMPQPGLPADVVARRPDVQAAWAALAAADHRTAAAIAARLPSLRLSASLLSVEDSLADLFSDAFWSLGTTLAGTIFDRGGLRTRIALQDARAEEALVDYADALLQSLREVHDALLRNASQDEFLLSLDAQYAEAETVLTLTRDSYRAGQVSYLDVLNALLSVQGLQRQRIDAHRQQLSNRIDLCRAAGVAPGTRSST